MIIPIIVLGLLVWFVWYYTKQSKAGPNYRTRFFDESPNSSKVLKRMEDDMVSEESREEFAAMEDRLISLMKQLYPSPTIAQAQSNQIKQRFPAYDFTYHDEILAWKSKLFDFSSRPTLLNFG
jgi:hypothetical protein